MHPGANSPDRTVLLAQAGVVLVGLHVLLLSLSRSFVYGAGAGAWPVRTLVVLELAAGAIYLVAVRAVRHTAATRRSMAIAVLVGALLRLAMLASTPMIEDDWYRYLWDGGVLANGLDPYRFSPSEARDRNRSGPIPAAWRRLAEASGQVVARVNHPDLRTVYPPVAQAAFAAAHWLKPWSLTSWRVVLICFEAATVVLLILLLSRCGLPSLWFVIYWWNPLVVKETVNSAHMDSVLFPFVLGAVLLALRGRHVGAAALLALGTGAKIWPVILLPVLLRPLLASPRRLAAPLVVFGTVSGALFLPVLLSGLDPDSGFAAYAGRWEMNDSLFMVLHAAVRAFPGRLGQAAAAGIVARSLAVILLAGWLAHLIRRPWRHPAELAERCLLAIAGLFLLSPTQFPWYALWFMPFLAVRPRGSLLVLTVLLPLYYLRFHFASRGNAALFDYGIVWLEFLPVWCLLLWEWRVARRREAKSDDAGDESTPGTGAGEVAGNGSCETTPRLP